MKKILLLAGFSVFLLLSPAHAAVVRPIAFPVQGERIFSDDFNSVRSGGRAHHAIDIMAPKMTPALAAADGTISEITPTEPSYGWRLVIRDDEGYEYEYVHLNNDTPGTDDGAGGYANAYASGIANGVRVTKGQAIAYVGDSGNAENVGSHLHFAMYDPSGAAIDPYESLLAAQKSAAPVPTAATTLTISADRGLIALAAASGCAADSLIKTPQASSVYYCGADGKRYVFPDEKTYFTWYADFSKVKTITANAMAAIAIGGNVTYRPGSRLLKIPSDARVFAVYPGSVLREIPSPAVAAQLYGAAWTKLVNDISEAFFINYKLGEPLT